MPTFMATTLDSMDTIDSMVINKTGHLSVLMAWNPHAGVAVARDLLMLMPNLHILMDIMDTTLDLMDILTDSMDTVLMDLLLPLMNTEAHKDSEERGQLRLKPNPVILDILMDLSTTFMDLMDIPLDFMDTALMDVELPHTLLVHLSPTEVSKDLASKIAIRGSSELFLKSIPCIDDF